jgi:hypothetical protein
MKTTTLMIGMVLAAGISTNASAQAWVNGTLGSAETATDKFYLTCTAGTIRMTYRVQRTIRGPNVNAKSYSPNGAIAQTDVGGTFSPLVTVKTGAGAKFFQVNKKYPVVGATTYTLNVECYKSNGLGGPTAVSPYATYIQNQ